MIDPLKGDISQSKPADIVVSYKPSLPCTAVAEIKFALSEFDFEPTTSLICASGIPALMKKKTIRKIDMKPRKLDDTLRKE